MSNLALHEYISRLPEEALQEFTEWCILEQAKEAGYDLTPNRSKLDNLPTGDYIHQLVDQFMQVKKNPIKDGLAAVLAGKQVDEHALPSVAAIVDFVSLYVKYLFPQVGKDEAETDAILAQASQQQLEKVSQIAQKYHVELQV